MATGTNSLNQDQKFSVESLLVGNSQAELNEAVAKELARSAMSARLVNAGSSITVTIEEHEGKVILLDTETGCIATLPDATGSGAIFKFMIVVTLTSGSIVIKVANASDEMRGFFISDPSEPTAVNIWWAVAGDDTVTFDRTTTGTAAQGHYVEMMDVTNNRWYVRGFNEQSGSEATPFSSTV